MRRMQCLLFVLAGLPGVVWGDDPLLWVQRMNQASRALSYAGTFVYQSQGRMETSRIVRVVDAAGEHERLETLDGPPREVLRHNDDLSCYLPADRLLVKDRAISGRQPGRLTAKPSLLGEFYSISLGEIERVAGREAQVLIFEPRDEMRYGHRLWVDVGSGLLLKARMLAGESGTLEQFAFTEVNTSVVGHDGLRSRMQALGQEWRVVNARGIEIRPEDIEWVFRRLPPGFRQVSLVKRTGRRGGDSGVIHAVFSDGLASVSVFIEPVVTEYAGVAQGGASSAGGSTGIFRRTTNDRLVTVLGEVPQAALRRIAEGVERRGR